MHAHWLHERVKTNEKVNLPRDKCARNALLTQRSRNTIPPNSRNTISPNFPDTLPPNSLGTMVHPKLGTRSHPTLSKHDFIQPSEHEPTQLPEHILTQPYRSTAEGSKHTQLNHGSASAHPRTATACGICSQYPVHAHHLHEYMKSIERSQPATEYYICSDHIPHPTLSEHDSPQLSEHDFTQLPQQNSHPTPQEHWSTQNSEHVPTQRSRKKTSFNRRSTNPPNFQKTFPPSPFGTLLRPTLRTHSNPTRANYLYAQPPPYQSVWLLKIVHETSSRFFI